MKINISVDVDWIEEDGNIDSEIQEQIIAGVKKAISASCLKRVENEASKSIEQAITNASKAIEDKAIKFADDWLKNEAEVTDKWGDVKEKTTISNLIKATFDNTLERKVDTEGRFSDNGYGSVKLIDYLTGKKVEAIVSEKLKGLTKDVDAKITDLINQGIKDRVSNKFAEMVIGYAKQDADEQRAITAQ